MRTSAAKLSGAWYSQWLQALVSAPVHPTSAPRTEHCFNLSSTSRLLGHGVAVKFSQLNTHLEIM